MGDSRGSIAFFATYRPPVALDIFSLPADPAAKSDDERPLTDGQSYNHNGREIPPAALKELVTFLRRKGDPKMGDAAKGLAFVSERDNGLETLHVALSSSSDDKQSKPTVLRLADIYGADNFGGVRLEDSACFAGGFQAGGRVVGRSLIYVSTKDPVRARRTPWTVVYKTNLADGKTERLTPPDQYDLSPAVSPSGKMVAVANFQFHRWDGEIEHLKTDIAIMNVDRQAQGGLNRKVIIRNAGWPTWGSDNVIFFHRAKSDPVRSLNTSWGVFRYDIAANKEERVTPDTMDAMTPAAISETRVAVATIRQKSPQNVQVVARVEAQYRHIEIFDVTALDRPVKITLNARGMADHYNPFVLDGGSRIGYHRCRTEKLVLQNGEAVAPKNFQKVQTPPSHKDVGMFRVSGVFPSFSSDGKKLAFVDNEFKAVWLADKDGLRVIHKMKGQNKVYSTSWNQNPDKDTLYICDGPAFTRAQPVQIKSLVKNKGEGPEKWTPNILTKGKFNNAFPSSSPDGSKLVFKSSRDRVPGGERMHTNLFVMEDADQGEWGDGGDLTQVTNGAWVDTHCSWAPRGDWIVFASSRDKAPGAPDRDLLDAGFFSVYLINAAERGPNKMPAPVRVVHSSETFRGHVNHPVFSPDMRSLVFTSDLAAVSVEPISMPIFIHSVRPYGDIFSVDLRDKDDMAKNQDITEFHRLTHSRYEYSTPAWTMFATADPNEQWNVLKTISDDNFTPSCPYLKNNAEGWQMTGHLTISRRCC
ncbi:hypothetical protein BAE44_0000999 [Dichanthelium oligosanthes]|uniref:Protein TolB n=1 Tax=Dichanthelium oligosanthes TaxID=888268 RepID=A0A1E5WKQ0_9POAL|nr:hypothetical protein BAE44_0000999 [Dichanthelium oligosanthes]